MAEKDERSIEERIAIIRNFVPRLEALVQGLTPEQLTTQYNPPEWTIAQNVHHLVDSHVNSFMRFKLILTEDNPPLKSYDQIKGTELADARAAYIDDSLMILRGLHSRWARMLECIEDDEWGRYGTTMASDRKLTLDYLLSLYANHGDWHLQQIQDVIDKMPTE